MQDHHNGVLMVDITALVKKPPLRTAWGRFLIPVREVLAAAFGMVLSAPIAVFFFRIGFPVGGFLTIAFAAAIGVFASQAKADGQSIPRYMLAAVRGRIGRHEINGEWLPVYVGLSRVRDFHDAKPVLIQRSAVEINPDLVDERGHIDMPRRP